VTISRPRLFEGSGRAFAGLPIEFDAVVKEASNIVSARNIPQSLGTELHSTTVGEVF
jgi:hypothetical protein